jgi:hypothetical protein
VVVDPLSLDDSFGALNGGTGGVLAHAGFVSENENVSSIKSGTRNIHGSLTGFFGFLIHHHLNDLTLNEHRLGRGNRLLSDPLLGEHQLLRIKFES